ncbi:hypothetical protein ABZ726_11025 [Streptomyces hundungensis]|uniref:hypothetical protein n=1 Tax=Streptomyces hundungensis TaxID=1077946 RepID=UPI0033DDD13D
MGRPEKQLPLDIPLSQQSLAEEIRALHKSSGLTSSELSAQIMYSAAAISQATSGKRRLPRGTSSRPSCWTAATSAIWTGGAVPTARRAGTSPVRPASPIITHVGEGSVPLLGRVPRARRQRRAEETTPPLHADGVLALVQQARK